MYENRYPPLWDDRRKMGQSFQDTDGEGDGEEVLSKDGQAREEGTGMQIEEGLGSTRQGFTVREVQKNEDGSHTYEIDGSDEAMQQLFQAFFLQALVNGIQYAEDESKKWIAKQEALEIADKLVRFLDVWETTDCFDYTPSVEEVKNELKDLLKKAGI